MVFKKLKSWAKINLSLNIIKRLQNNYHSIESLITFVDIFDEIKINSDEAFEKLAADKLILRKMTQYKISNSLRLTIGNKESNEHFIKAIGSILKWCLKKYV